MSFDPTRGLPPGLQAALKAQFGEDAEIINLGALRDEFTTIPVNPVTLAQARALLECSQWEPQAGDLVMLNPEYPFSTAHMKWPVPGEVCLVTRVLNSNLTDMIGESDESGLCRPAYMVLGFSHKCGDDSCMQEGTLVEYTHDPRMFKRVGSVYDRNAAEPSRPEFASGTRTGRQSSNQRDEND